MKLIGSPKQRTWAGSIISSASPSVKAKIEELGEVLKESTWFIDNEDTLGDERFWEELTVEQAALLNEDARKEKLARRKVLPTIASTSEIEVVVLSELSDLMSKVAFIEGRPVTPSEALKILIEAAKPELKKLIAKKNLDW